MRKVFTLIFFPPAARITVNAGFMHAYFAELQYFQALESQKKETCLCMATTITPRAIFR
jgi:hypothetical protein